MKVLRMRSWNFHAENLDQMTRFYQNALGAEVRTQHTVGGVKVNSLARWRDRALVFSTPRRNERHKYPITLLTSKDPAIRKS